MAGKICLVIACVLMLSNKVNSQCSATSRRATETDTVNAEPTYLTSPGWKTAYYSNTDCRWTLSVSDVSHKIVVDVMESYFEGSPGCSYDYLGIYDGNSLSSTATKLCNNLRTGQLFVSSGPNVMLRLKSDFSVNYPGFSLRYFIGTDYAGTGCAAMQTLTATSTVQYLSSPNFPDEYDTANDCEWTITSSSKSLRIEVIFADMLDGEVCYSDQLLIYDGTDSSSTKLAEICDSSATFIDSEAYYSTGLNAFINFKSLQSGRNRRGFLIAYNETDTVVAVPSTTPSTTFSTCGSISLTITNLSTPLYITTPDYPIFYSSNLNCEWQVTGPQGSVLQIKVLDFFLENSEECFGDNVKIYDGPTSAYSRLALSCGEIGTDVNSTGNIAMLAFKSDGSTSARGFKYQIEAIGSGTPDCVNGNPTDLNATLERQYFNSATYPSNYGSGITEQWLIYNTLSYDYEIVIETVDSRIEDSVNCEFDKVKLYEGPCTTYSTLATFCGVVTPTYTQFNGLYVLVVFTTDDSAFYRGFNISYYLREVTTSGLTTKQIVGMIIGIVIGVIVFGVLMFLLFKKVIIPKLKSGGHGSTLSLRSRRSSSSSSSSSSSDEESGKRKRRLKPIPKASTVLLRPSSKYSMKPKLPSISQTKS
ncbi:scavenger receptor cysteine-rich domain-containing protein DMBT1-like isoform X1 [Mytilus galloprovincialis]|uniref:scavenger receptor cysteine-rich domain-containing protein DMBT1-like isoform X1 n=2 Tax=Mytilus galloprovincialis TaxID=29158 RepID=UPI003F7BFA25